jgi:hypothetical protein
MFSPLCPDGPGDTHFTPWQVVYFYYAYVHAGDYSDAWALMSPGWQAIQGSYERWKAGYAGANNGHVSEVSQHGDIVNVIVTQPEKCFDGAYQVDHNKITTGRLSSCTAPSSSPSATSTTSPATVVKIFDPWGAARRSGAATPAPGLVVTNGGTATCDSGSSDDPGSALAVRCTPPGNGMPCFINDTGGGDPGSPVLCSGDPTSGQVTKITPAGPTGIPVGTLNQANPNAPAWFLILADGRKCAFQGYGTNTNVLSYDCGGNIGATVPDRSQPAWTVHEGTLRVNPTPSATRVAVVTAYQ